VTLFQVAALTVIALLVLRETIDLARGRRGKRLRLLRMLVWFSAGTAIAFPEVIQDAAILLGIGRGADAVLYVFVLVFLATTFFFYAQFAQQQQQLTQLVRHLAIRDATRKDPTTATEMIE